VDLLMYFWPFQQNPLGLIPQTINYDLVVEEPYPGVCFYPQVAGAVYSELRVVNAACWWVINAMWDPNTLQWEQNPPCNSALPAYALIQDLSSGAFRRAVAPATDAINTAVVWTYVLSSDQYGDVNISPLTLTGSSEVAENLAPTWNAGGAIMVARQELVTDTASNAASALDKLTVNGTTVWEVRKDGTLVIGIVPTSAISGGIVSSIVAGTGILVTNVGSVYTVGLAHGDYVDLGNAQTITGSKTFTQPLLYSDGSFSGNIGGAVYMAYGAYHTGTTWVALETSASIVYATPTGFSFYVNMGLTIGNTFIPTGVLTINSSGSISTNGNLQAAGGVFTANVVVDGNLTVDGTLTASAGIVNSIDGLSGVVGLTSPDSSIGITTAGNTIQLSWSPTLRAYGGHGTTNSGGMFAVTVPYVVLGASANVGQTYPGTASYQVDIDQASSNFALGYVSFYGISGSSLAGSGLGIYYTIVTSNTLA
jgi:hypothetical protein